MKKRNRLATVLTAGVLAGTLIIPQGVWAATQEHNHSTTTTPQPDKKVVVVVTSKGQWAQYHVNFLTEQNWMEKGQTGNQLTKEEAEQILTKASGHQVFLPNNHRITILSALVQHLGLAEKAAALTESEVATLLAPYQDRNAIPESDRQAVAYLLKEQIVKGVRQGVLAPHQEIQRGELAALIHRILKSTNQAKNPQQATKGLLTGKHSSQDTVSKEKPDMRGGMKDKMAAKMETADCNAEKMDEHMTKKMEAAKEFFTQQRGNLTPEEEAAWEAFKKEQLQKMKDKMAQKMNEHKNPQPNDGQDSGSGHHA